LASAPRRKRAIAYLRVSTADQVEGYGRETQEKAVRGYAKGQGIRLVDVVRDEGISGAKSDLLRPGLGDALVRLEAGEADALLVPRLDRLARDLVLQETIIARLTRAGREVLSVAEPDLNGDHTRDLVRQILGAIAQYERALIAARMSAGKALKKAKGGYVGGRPRYGFEALDGELSPLAKEQMAIQIALRLRKEGLSLRMIGQRLGGAGFQPKVGAKWHPTQVSRLLRGRRRV
jgi:DNA invertase Pin-like site-specific DNA recombinase